MKNKAILICLILVITALLVSGCLDFFNSGDQITTSTPIPTKVRYTITYGYRINCTDIGHYNIIYDCEVPSVLSGEILSMEILDSNYENKIIANNPMKSWNISSSENANYVLGLTATVECNGFVVSDLSGSDALTLQEMISQHRDLIDQYCNAQSNETTKFIDPLNADISEVADGVLERAGTSNTFLIAKELFIWLKDNTEYERHPQSSAQPCDVTLKSRKGDCDDLTFLYISLCRSLNIPARFIRGFLVEKDSTVPIAHAWAEVYVGGDLGDEGWISVECTGDDVNQNFGLETTEYLRLFKDDGSNESMIASLTAVTYSINVQEPELIRSVSDYTILQQKSLVIENGHRSYK